MKKLVSIISLLLLVLSINAQAYGGYRRVTGGVRVVEMQCSRGYWEHVCRPTCPYHHPERVYTGVLKGQPSTTVSNNSGTVIVANNGSTVNYYGCGECKEHVKPLPTDSNATMGYWYFRFPMGTSKWSRRSDAELAKMAEFARLNPDCIFYVDGYADEKTGTGEGNMKLSRERADIVAKHLIPYVGESRINIRYNGSSEQVHHKNDMNRCVEVRAYKPNNIQ